MAEFLKLKKSNCKNCYKCIRHCPVKSIRFSGNQAHIVQNECILCGRCFVVCPQDAKQIADSTEAARTLMSGRMPVIASLAPSFVANYENVGIDAMKEALLKLGFADVEETAIGAAMVTKEYEKILEKAEQDIVITSCCHSINLLIQKYFPTSIPYLADVMSPMQAHAADIKRRNPDAKVVFIGPCVAKKDEAAYYEGVDAVLTFEELSAWLQKENIEIEQKSDMEKKGLTRLYPTTGGILKTMNRVEGYHYLAIDGVENCMEALRDIEAGKLHKCFIEMSACIGSCVGGPVIEKARHSVLQGAIAVSEFAGKEHFEVAEQNTEDMKKSFGYFERDNTMPSETEIRDILRQMGKNKPSDELNCGTCGYDTCREKAIAIFRGKAEISMCLPYLKDRAETFSDAILKNTPNGIFVLNENLEVQQINKAALRMMNIARESDVLGEPVVCILDPKIFMDVKRTGRGVDSMHVYLAEYDRYVDQSIVFDRESRILICTMRDVTEEETEREKKEEVNRHTLEIADKVVEKQMRIVQEIASLLGETAAETKIALTKLKESIADE